jgi:hypothetical protein
MTGLLARLADRLGRERFDIGRNNDVYLTRWTLFGSRLSGTGRAVFLHRFHRSDYDDALHDHPWPFVSVVLSGGYYEHAVGQDGIIRRRWFGPGRVLSRPAEWRHRIELSPGTEGRVFSLVFRGVKTRSWFFHCLSACGTRLSGKAVPWRSFIDRIESGALGCGSEG